MLNNTYTFNANDNIIRFCPNLYLHFGWGLTLMITGFIAILLRIIGYWKPWVLKYHPIVGKVWFYGMIVQLYTSIWSRNDGLRIMIMIFGVTCYGCLIAGHAFIRCYQAKRIMLEDEMPLNTYKTDKDNCCSCRCELVEQALVLVCFRFFNKKKVTKKCGTQI